MAHADSSRPALCLVLVASAAWLGGCTGGTPPGQSSDALPTIDQDGGDDTGEDVVHDTGTDDTGEDGDTGDTGDPVEEFSVVLDEDAMRRLADHLVAVQQTDGGYLWQHNVGEAYDPEAESYQNVTGVSAWGFHPALARQADADWDAATDHVAAYFAPRLEALAQDPTDQTAMSCPNWTFLAEWLSRNPDAGMQAFSVAALDALILARDAEWGDDPDTRVDGMVHYNIYRRSSIPGIVGWDQALCVEALGAMHAQTGMFGDDYADAAARLASHVETDLLPGLDADPGYLYADISVANALFVLLDAPGDHAQVTAGLQDRLEGMMDADGMISNGSSDDGPQQASVYGLLALKRLEHDDAQLVQDYAESQIDADGVVSNAETGIEVFEVEGELLRAIAW
jgi:hypothetical protein